MREMANGKKNACPGWGKHASGEEKYAEKQIGKDMNFKKHAQKFEGWIVQIIQHDACVIIVQKNRKAA